MGKPSRGRGSRPPKRGGVQVQPRQMDAKYFDEHLFKKQRDKISLTGMDDSDVSDDDMEQPVMDIPEDTSESEDDEDDEGEEEDLDEHTLTGFAAKMAKQAKVLRQKQAAIAAAEEDEEEEGERKEKTAWGKSKKSYYSGDNVDFELQSSDEEAPVEEEAEALRLQQQLAASLRPEDYEQDEEEESLEEAVKRLGEKPTKKKSKEAKQPKERTEPADNGMTVERVQKDVSLLSKEEQMAVVMSDAPELVGLLTELRESLDELRNKIVPLEAKVRAGELATKDGLSYLEVKHLLLLSYCQAIIFYLLLKAEGRSVRDHPVIARLVELRLFMEKIRPIDKKLKYQIDKLVKSSDVSNGAENAGDKDALKYRPNPSLLVSKLDTDGQEAGAVYRPPMIAPTAMEEDMRPADKRSRDRAEKEVRRRSVRSAFVKELADDLEGKPEELMEVIGAESKEMLRERQKLEARARQEEDLFARVPLSKAERKKLKHLKRSRSGLMGMLDDFDDDVADLVGMDDGNARKATGGPPDDLLQSRKLSQIIAEASHPPKKQRVDSGDANLPLREDIGDRRNKHEIQKASRNQNGREESPDESQDIEPDEDDFYQEAKELQASKKATKSAKYSRELTVVPAEEDFEGKRNISRQMEKNRGLTPHRKKLTKNPRKKYKLKHEKAVIRRKGQVREVKAALKPYAGEATGIRTNISRSVRMQG